MGLAPGFARQQSRLGWPPASAPAAVTPAPRPILKTTGPNCSQLKALLGGSLWDSPSFAGNGTASVHSPATTNGVSTSGGAAAAGSQQLANSQTPTAPQCSPQQNGTGAQNPDSAVGGAAPQGGFSALLRAPSPPAAVEPKAEPAAAGTGDKSPLTGCDPVGDAHGEQVSWRSSIVMRWCFGLKSSSLRCFTLMWLRVGVASIQCSFDIGLVPVTRTGLHH